MSLESSYTQQDQIVVIGADLAGLIFALALQLHSIPCTVYAARSRSARGDDAMMMSPNSLGILDKMELYSRIENRRISFERVEMRVDRSHEIMATRSGSEEFFGYKELKMYRQVLIDELVGLCEERRLNILWERPLEEIVSESEDVVELRFNDGTVVKASTLVRADGSHGRIRWHGAAGSRHSYTTQTSVVSPVGGEDVVFPSGEYRFPVSLVGKNSVCVTVRRDIDRSETPVGTLTAMSVLDEEGNRGVAPSSTKVLDLVSQASERASEVVKSAVDNLMLRGFIFGHSMSSQS